MASCIAIENKIGTIQKNKSKMENTKAYLLEGQILHQIQKNRDRIEELNKLKSAKEISAQSYDRQWFMCKEAIDQLTLVLTCHDNPLSNFLSKNK